MKSDDLEIARILHLKFGNQKSQIGQTKVGNGWQAKGGTLREEFFPRIVQFEISDF